MSILPLNNKRGGPQLLASPSHNKQQKWGKKQTQKWPSGEVESLRYHHYIWASPEGGDMLMGLKRRMSEWWAGKKERVRFWWAWSLSPWVKNPTDNIMLSYETFHWSRNSFTVPIFNCSQYCVTLIDNGPVHDPSVSPCFHQACLHSINLPPKPAWPLSATSWQSTHCSHCFRWTIKETSLEIASIYVWTWLCNLNPIWKWYCPICLWFILHYYNFGIIY